MLKGVVVLNGDPVQGCIVYENTTLSETITDSEGRFEILTSIGATLNFEYIDMKPKQLVIKDNSEQIVKLESQYEVLSEVAIEGKTASEKKEELSSKEQREAQKYRSGIGYQSIDKEDFNEGGYNFLVDLIRGRFLTIGVNGEGDQARYYTRKPSSINLDPTIVFAVDGVIFKDPPTWINLRSIENITFKSTLAGTTKYGALGRNGVIEITTQDPKATQSQEISKELDIKNNYEDTAQVFSSKSHYTQLKSISPEGLVKMRKEFLLTIEKNPLEVNNYIAYYKVLEAINPQEALRGLLTIIEMGDNNTRVLRSLAFFLEDQGLSNEAIKIHERILEVAPKEPQSYIDLAQSYANGKRYKESFEQWKAILVGDTIIFKPNTELYKITESEIKHLLTKYKDKVSYEDVPISFYETATIVDKRILVEWNDPQMEFDLQFVNPKKKFYNWSQTLSRNDGIVAKNVEPPVKGGLLSKEFIIDDDPTSGEWLVNITNNTPRQPRIPSFIKMTVYTNYGDSKEQKQILIIPVSQLDQKYTVQKIAM